MQIQTKSAAVSVSRSQITIPRGKSKNHSFKISEPNTHLCVTAEESAQAEITVEIGGSGKTMCLAMEVIVKKNAKVRVLCLNQAHAESRVHITQNGEIQEQGELHWQNMTLGGSDVSHSLVSRTFGEHAKSTIDWISYAKGKEKQQLSARNIFDAENGEGEVTMRGVAEEKAHVTSEGMIEITEKGRGTNAFLRETALMLDPTAKVDAIPGLEIRTNDVKASHAATVARVSPEDLFYFSSRGITEREARKMYIEGFLGDLMQHLPKQPVPVY